MNNSPSPLKLTALQLAQHKSINQTSMLHCAALNSFLPPDTTIELLKNTKNLKGESAWEYLILFATKQPVKALAMPITMFQNHSSEALEFANSITQKHPNLRATTTIWLGHVFAANPLPVKLSPRIHSPCTKPTAP